MPRRPTSLLAAATATVICFAGFVACGFYAAVDENIGAGFLSLVFIVLTLSSVIWCIVAVVIRRRRRIEPRGFAVLTVDRGDSTRRGGGDG
jgi:hypothetical protein